MKKSQVNLWKQQFFFSEAFQNKWKKYLEAFGNDLGELFGDDYDSKLRLSAGLEHLINRRFNDAYHEIRHFESACITDADRQVFHRLITLCLNENEMSKVKVGDWIKESGIGYYQVVKITHENAVIKLAFDSEFVYVDKSWKVDCFKITITDLKTYQFLENDEILRIKAFFSENPEKEISFLKNTDKILQFREEILSARFDEAKHDFRQFNFYRYTSEKVAFIVNLKDFGEYIQIVYGFTSVADDDYFQKHGEDDSDIKLRYCAVIKTEQDEETVASMVKNIFDTYLSKTKDEILLLKKDRQKQFLQKISDKLKPLGFKKKGTKWIKALTNDFCLEFEAQKSQWSDEYYLNVSVYHKDVQFPQCYIARVNTNEKNLYNWQIMTDEEINCLLNEAVQSILMPIIKTPITDLGKNKDMQGYICPGNKCDICWLQKTSLSYEEIKA